MNEKSNIGKLFDSIAKSYDNFNHITSFGLDKKWRKKAIEKIKSKGGSMLDVAIGTADLSIEAFKQEKARHIVGIDLSQEMMNIGKEKCSRLGLDKKIEFIKASALEIPFLDESFEIVSCAYGIRNFSELEKGLSQMYRCLKTGGELVILEFSYPQNPFVKFFYNLYFSNIMPLIGKILNKDSSAFKYFLRSVKEFIYGEEMLKKLEEIGFTNCEKTVLSLGITTIYTATKPASKPTSK